MVSITRSNFLNFVKKTISHEFLSHIPKERTIFCASIRTSAILNAEGIKINMPSLSPTMTMGTIVKWYKKEGDTISPGDVLCDIQTDKAVMSFETEEEGILAKILIPEGTSEINVGTLIGLMVSEGEDWKAVEIPSDGGSASTSSTSTTEPVNTGGTVPGLSITMPSLSPTMSEGTIVKWHKKEGDTIAPGDVLCDIQTDKAVMSFETEEEGILAKILIAEGISGISVGSLIGVMVAEGEDWQNVMIPTGTSKQSEAFNSSETSSAPNVTIKSEPTQSHKITNYGPAVRALVDFYQINSDLITPTGKNKKLLKADVLNYITANKLQPKPPLPVPLPKRSSTIDEPQYDATTTPKRATQQKYVDIELSSMRKTIANRLTMSKTTIPHAYATVNSEIDQLLSFRAQMKSAGINVSVNDFVIKAVALALKSSPFVNTLYANDQLVPAANVDISVAVATETGLITPIIKNADQKSVDEISQEIKELANKARLGKLQLHEFQGGSFTISNLGMFGITEFSAIINPPQCAILAVGGGRPYIDLGKKVRTKMTSTLSYDSRAISESAAADFLENLQYLLQNPVNILINSNKKVAARSV